MYKKLIKIALLAITAQSSHAQFLLFDETMPRTTVNTVDIGNFPTTEGAFSTQLGYDLGGGLNVSVDYQFTPATEYGTDLVVPGVGTFDSLIQNANGQIVVSPGLTTFASSTGTITKTYTFNQAINYKLNYSGWGQHGIGGAADVAYNYTEFNTNGAFSGTLGNGLNSFGVGYQDGTGEYRNFDPGDGTGLTDILSATNHFGSASGTTPDGTIEGTGTQISVTSSQLFQLFSAGPGPQTESYSFEYQSIPEPSTFTLVGLGAIALLRRRR